MIKLDFLFNKLLSKFIKAYLCNCSSAVRLREASSDSWAAGVGCSHQSRARDAVGWDARALPTNLDLAIGRPSYCRDCLGLAWHL